MYGLMNAVRCHLILESFGSGHEVSMEPKRSELLKREIGQEYSSRERDADKTP